MKLIPLKLAGLDIHSTANELKIVCRRTGKVLKWRQAVLEGWSVDIEDRPFAAYYSPENKNENQ